MKKLILITALLACSSSWGACISGNCNNGFGTYTFADGNKYEGEWQESVQHGQGTFTWSNGAKYEGEWKEGNRHGQGTATWPTGSIFVGEYKDDIRQGQGTYTWGENTKWAGQKYVGDWKNSKKHGQGTESYADGSSVTGIFENDNYIGTIAEFNFLEDIRKAEKLKRKAGERKAKEAEDRLVEARALQEANIAKEFEAKKAAERKVSEAGRKKYDRIFNACLLDKSSDVDMQVSALRAAVIQTCKAIAKEPSWLETLKYN